MTATEAADKILAATARLEAEAKAAKIAAKAANQKLALTCKGRAMEALEELKALTLRVLALGLSDEVGAELKRRGF